MKAAATDRNRDGRDAATSRPRRIEIQARDSKTVNHHFTYRRGRWIVSSVVQDLLLAIVLAGLLILHPTGPLALGLGAAIPVVMAWGMLTLHFPSRVETDDMGIAFSGYGRTHRYAWHELERVHVRRFLVQDRVLVRLVPAPALAGRYWLLDSLEGYDTLVRMLEERSRIETQARDRR